MALESQDQLPASQRLAALSISVLVKTVIKSVLWLGIAWGITRFFPTAVWAWYVAFAFIAIGLLFLLVMFLAAIRAAVAEERELPGDGAHASEAAQLNATDGREPVFKSALDPAFRSTLDSWLQERDELLVMFRYPYAGGARDYELHRSADSILQRASVVPPHTSVIVFRQPQVQLRGTVTSEFIVSAMEFIPDDVEFLLVETEMTVAGTQSWFHDAGGVGHGELREALEQSMGRPVMLGRYPPWREDGPDVTSGYVPDRDGRNIRGAY